MHTLVIIGLAAIPAAMAVTVLTGAVYGCLYLIRCVNIARRVTRGRGLQRAH